MKNEFGIVVFKGNKQEYESFAEHECKVVGANAELYPQAIYLDGELLKKDEAKNIEALINSQKIPCEHTAAGNSIFGLPVKKKE